ncbi:ferrochelatase [Candidatus Riflebacteria bacterium]
MAKDCCFLFMQLGSPANPGFLSVRQYLKEFLSDPRVIDKPPFGWKFILHAFILTFRCRTSAKMYKKIWEGEEFPISRITREFCKKIARNMPGNIIVDYCYSLSEPRIHQTLKRVLRLSPKKIYFIPLFPQYSEATTAGCMDRLSSFLKDLAYFPDFEFLSDFSRLKAYIDSSACLVNRKLKRWQKENSYPDSLILSFHGLPKRRVLIKGDPYYQQCCETAELMAERISFDRKNIHIAFQSRFGREEWLEPATRELALTLISEGQKNIAIHCPAFTTDCLETLEEINSTLRKEIEAAGGNLFFIPCLNTGKEWIRSCSRWLLKMATRSRKEIADEYYDCLTKRILHWPEQ